MILQDGVCTIYDIVDMLAASPEQSLALLQDCSSSYDGPAPIIDITNRSAVLQAVGMIGCHHGVSPSSTWALSASLEADILQLDAELACHYHLCCQANEEVLVCRTLSVIAQAPNTTLQWNISGMLVQVSQSMHAE